MEYIYIGEIVNTHGLKGEIRINSDFKFKESVFLDKMKFYIGKDKDEVVMNTYRKHKQYDMVTFMDKNHIDEVIIYKNEPIYINRSDIEYEGYLNEDLIGLEVYCEDNHIGRVDSILSTPAHDVLIVKNGNKHMIPNINEFIKEVDLAAGKLIINYMRGLLNED